jgi:predicted ester cyclase
MSNPMSDQMQHSAGATEASKTKEVARGFYDSYQDGDIDATFDRYVAPDAVTHALDEPMPRAGWLAANKATQVGLANMTFHIKDQIAERDRVATRFVITGTHVGEFHGVPATGTAVTLRGTSIDRVENGLIVEHWADMGAVRDQLAS